MNCWDFARLIEFVESKLLKYFNYDGYFNFKRQNMLFWNKMFKWIVKKDQNEIEILRLQCLFCKGYLKIKILISKKIFNWLSIVYFDSCNINYNQNYLGFYISLHEVFMNIYLNL